MSGLILWRGLAVAAAVTAAGAAQAQAPSWRVVAIDGDGDHGASVAYVDTATMTRDGDEIRFDMLVRFQSPPPEIDRLRGRMRADCAGRRWGAESSATYLGETPVRQFGAVELEPVRPGTNSAGVIDGVCGNNYLTGPVEPDEHSRTLFAK